MKQTQGITEHFLQLRRKLNKWNKVVLVLAAIAVFVTVYALILPATTLNKNTASNDPAIDINQEMTDFNPKLQAQSDNYVVGIKYGSDADIPDGSQLRVTEIKKNSSEYKSAKKAVVEANKKTAKQQKKSFHEKDLGLAAVDVSILDSNGNEIEPKGKVDVKIAMKNLPDAASQSGVVVQHITDHEADEDAAAGSDVKATKLAAQSVGGKTAVDPEGQGTADFTVSSFSVFTITWNKNTDDDNTRIGNVSLHYVTDKGLEKDTAQELTADDLKKLSQNNNGIVKISDWMKTLSDSTYSFDHAVIGDRQNGAEVTGVKVQSVNETREVKEENTTTTVTFTGYKLYYTSASDPSASGTSWTEYKDSASASDKSQDNNADIWMIYTSRNVSSRQLRLHFVNEGGQSLDISTVRAQYNNVASNPRVLSIANDSTYTLGYQKISGFKETRYGSFDKPLCTLSYSSSNDKSVGWLKYTVSSNTVTTEYRSNTNGTTNTYNGAITDVYLVYNQTVANKSFTVNYKYQGQDGAYADAYINGHSATKTDTFSLAKGQSKNLVTDSSTESGWADVVHDKQDDQYGVKKVSDNNNLSYMATRLGSVDGPEVSSVRVKNDGGIVYTTDYSYTLKPSEEYRNRYVVDDSSAAQNSRQGLQGRRVVITVDDHKNVTLSDSQMGTIPMNLVNEDSGNPDVRKTYAATLHTDTGTAEYKATTGDNAYKLNVTISIPSTNTNIYQVYVDGDSQANDKIWIKDDVPYSGLYRVGMSDKLRNTLGSTAASDITYTWYQARVDRNAAAPDPKSNPGTKVTLKQTGNNYNISSDARYATWLNLEADEGSETWGSSQDIYYYATVSYTENGERKSVTSTPIKVNWYGQLENGSFETPVVPPTGGGYQYPNSDNEAGASVTQSYASQGGVWHTTGLGTGNKAGKDIEIVNTENDNHSFRSSYSWQGEDGAVDGTQFAELNCEAAGALYQDVVTHSGEPMSYGLSHRARGAEHKAANPKNSAYTVYDTMYLVIMPTQLAMTAGPGSTELKKQEDLTAFIQSHGGFSGTTATGPENEITYNQNGVLIRKISSSNQGWHTISVTNGYTATGGLTRFFFVAGPTASGNNTVGNFLDNVWFSQTLPTPKGFNLTVEKTFSGLTQKQLAAMATNASNNGNDSSSSKPFTFTITNTYDTDKKNNTALQNAKLQFTATQTDAAGERFSFTATAKQWLHKKSDSPDTWEPITEESYNSNKSDTQNYKEVDLFNNEVNGGDVRLNADGSVTMTWSFAEQALDGAGTTGTTGNYSGNYSYTVEETNDNVAGYNLSSSSSSTTSHPDKDNNNVPLVSTPTSTGVLNLQSGYTATYNFTNAYRQDHVIVQKTFSGLTNSTLNTMQNETDDKKQYSLTVTKGTGNEAPSKKLTLSGTQDDDVTLAMTNGSGGKRTYTWTIDGWGQGENYSVKEENVTSPDSNKEPSQIKVNGDVLSDSDLTDKSKSSLNVGEASNITYDGLNTQATPINSDTAPFNSESNKNFVLAKYTAQAASEAGEGETAATNSTSVYRYLVWTSRPMGSRERTAIANEVKTLYSLTDTTTPNITFISGTTVAPTVVPDGDESYQVVDGVVTFTNGTNSATTWQTAYGANITVNPDLTVENIYDPVLKLKKVDSSNSNMTLKGAKFKLYKLNSSSQKDYFISRNETSGEITWAPENATQKGYEFEVNSDSGNDAGIVEIGVLPVDYSNDTTYYLEETKAPDGYNKLAKAISFVVHTDGTVIEERKKATGPETATTPRNDETVDNTAARMTVEYEQPYFLITVKDESGVVLPSTGGPGDNILLALAGLALVAMAAGGAYAWRRRPVGRHGA